MERVLFYIFPRFVCPACVSKVDNNARRKVLVIDLGTVSVGIEIVVIMGDVA